MKSLGVCAALCLCGLLALPPAAQAGGNRRCAQSEVTDDLSLNPGYSACVSFIPGTFALRADLQALEDFFGFPWRPLGYSTDAGFGPFSADPAGLRSGTLQLDAPRRDFFAVGLEGGGEYLFYSFDYTSLAATQSIAFDTLGLTDLPGPLLDVAALYVPANGGTDPDPPGGVPEPGTLMLALAGVFALATRRRGDHAS